MSEMLLINPAYRKKAKRASPARKRAKRTKARRAKNTVPHYCPNPTHARRRRVSAVKKHRARRRSSYKRNPIAGLSMGSITSLAKGALIGAAGAVAVDVAFGYAKSVLPASMQSPVDVSGNMNPMYFLAKGGVAVLLGVLGKKITRQAGKMAEGSLTVTMYDALKGFVPASIALGYVSPGAVLQGHRQSSLPRPVNRPQVAQYVGGYDPSSARMREGMGQYVK